MNNVYETYETKEYKISIVFDIDAESPRKFECNLGTMICEHPRYFLGDIQADFEEFINHIADELEVETQVLEDEGYYEDRELLEIFEECSKKAIILPLYLYDHSGISIRVFKHGYHQDWDCGQVGYIYVSHKKILEEYGNLNEDTLKKVEQYLEGEVETYSDYLEGNVFGCKIEKKVLCEHCGSVELKEVDFCWGFYGSDIKENGIEDMLLENGIDVKKIKK